MFAGMAYKGHLTTCQGHTAQCDAVSLNMQICWKYGVVLLQGVLRAVWQLFHGVVYT